jgi:hypothetical protein
VLGARCEDLWLAACVLAAVRPLYRGFRTQHFELPAKRRAFHEWVEQTYPEAWASLPKWERKYLNPQFGINRLRRDRLVATPEFEQRWQELRRCENAAGRPLLTAGALVLLGMTPAVVRRLSL